MSDFRQSLNNNAQRDFKNIGARVGTPATIYWQDRQNLWCAEVLIWDGQRLHSMFVTLGHRTLAGCVNHERKLKREHGIEV